jgi:hypothetical protein
VPASGEQPQLPAPEVTGGTGLVRVKAAGLNAINNGIARDRALPASPARRRSWRGRYLN